MELKKHYNICMLIDCDTNLIAAWRSIEDVLPYPQYKAGTRPDQQGIYEDKKDPSSNPILILEFDILNEHGYGLKNGFYELAVDSEYKFLMFVQAGNIMAKIPVVSHSLINESGLDYEWHDDKDKSTPNEASKDLTEGIMVSSKKIYTKKFSEKEEKRRKKKYQKGQDPLTHFHSKAYMEYDKELRAYKVFFEKYNTRIMGIMKI